MEVAFTGESHLGEEMDGCREMCLKSLMRMGKGIHVSQQHLDLPSCTSFVYKPAGQGPMTYGGRRCRKIVCWRNVERR